VWGVSVLDPLPPPLPRRRGAARSRATLLRDSPDQPGVADELRRRGVARASELARIGVRLDRGDECVVRIGDWLLDRSAVPELSQRLRVLVTEHTRHDPLAAGLPVAAATQRLGLPDVQVTTALVAPPLRVVEGRIRIGSRDGDLPAQVEAALNRLEDELAEHPFAAPNADRLCELGLDARALAAAERAGRLLRLTPEVVVLPRADERAAVVLSGLPQPFTASQARTALGTSRRVVLPLLARLDARGRTVRLADDTRRVIAPQPADGRATTRG
jgi:selenocysteine-specific elongation factor